MYITADIVAGLETRFGTPVEISLEYEMSERELNMVRHSQKHRRAHDVTLFIIEGERIVVIKKPQYPPGAYRAPSGGINPGEQFEAGALREAHEETGLSIRLDRYVVRSQVRFNHKSDFIDWTSHVFAATIQAGELNPIDTEEIVEARFATVDELLGSVRQAMLGSGSTGLKYRSDLNDFVIRRLQALEFLR